MALIVETGAGIPGADSYVSLADALTYHGDRGNTAWGGAASDSVREAALRNATAYIDGWYRACWKGRRVQPTTQSLEWPRYGVSVVEDGKYYGYLTTEIVIPSDSIPLRLQAAVCEAALISLSGALIFDRDLNIRRQATGPLVTEYFQGDQGHTYKIIDMLISDFITPRGSGVLVRG